MQETINELEGIILEYLPLIQKFGEEQLLNKPAPGKWSKKEELGHLVDSALSNSRRFIIGQYEIQPHIVYNQEKWVSITNYQDYPSQDLISPWVLINKHIIQIWKNTSPENAERMVQTQELHSIAWLSADYNKHLLHHLHHLLDLEPISYP